ncbi:MAG: hypothetical protein R2771_00170 [Saprospiraceae bacterium]
MKDLAEVRKLNVDINKLKEFSDSDVIFISNKTKENREELKNKVFELTQNKTISKKTYYKLSPIEKDAVSSLSQYLNGNTEYQKLLEINHSDWIKSLTKDQKADIDNYKQNNNFSSVPLQINETLTRFRTFDNTIKSIVRYNSDKSVSKSITDKIDKIVTNRILGPDNILYHNVFCISGYILVGSIPYEYVGECLFIFVRIHQVKLQYQLVHKSISRGNNTWFRRSFSFYSTDIYFILDSRNNGRNRIYVESYFHV